MRGGKKGLVDCEKKVANFAFGSVVSSNKIKKGEKLTKKNIWVRRPGNGFYKAKDYTSLIGKIASRDIKNNFQLKKNDIKKN
jgi:N-acetylneuraminate synthase